MKLVVRSLTEDEARAQTRERGFTLGAYLRAGGAPAMAARPVCRQCGKRVLDGPFRFCPTCRRVDLRLAAKGASA